jgi:DNA-directed RNA polymerase subunit RPC12/RpoP
MAQPAPAKCANCGAAYKVVKVESPSPPTEITCQACGARLEAREGKYLLKYFLVEKPPRERRVLQVS